MTATTFTDVSTIQPTVFRPGPAGVSNHKFSAPCSDTKATIDLAIFDLDRTLIHGSSLARLGKTLMDQGILKRRHVVGNLARNAIFAARGLSPQSVESIVERLLALVAGRESGPLLEAAAAVGRQVACDVFPAARALVEQHRRAGHTLVLLSSSPQVLVESVAMSLGLHVGVGTVVEVRDERFTGRLAHPFCYGAGKLKRLQQELGPSVDLGRAASYADSFSDLPVLQSSQWPVAVNPDRNLRRVARANGWPVMGFRPTSAIPMQGAAR